MTSFCCDFRSMAAVLLRDFTVPVDVQFYLRKELPDINLLLKAPLEVHPVFVAVFCP